MMKKTLDHSLVAVLSLSLFSGVVSAHTQSGSLGKPATATDIYQVSCLDNGNGLPAYLSVQIKDLPPILPPVLSVTISKAGKSQVTNDPIDGDSKYSPAIRIDGGSGAYTMSVSKNGVGVEIYSLQYHCMTASNVETGSSQVKKQDQ